MISTDIIFSINTSFSEFKVFCSFLFFRIDWLIGPHILKELSAFFSQFFVCSGEEEYLKFIPYFGVVKQYVFQILLRLLK